jgi:uncharacterized membrane protein
VLLSEVNNFRLLSFEQRPKIILVRLLFLSFLSIWIYGFLLSIIAPTENFVSNYLLTRIYSIVCHQESVKCISLGSATMLVCARCSGIYAGALIAGLLSLLVTLPAINIKVLLISTIPLAMDVFFTFTEVYAYSKSVAFVTSLAFGSTIYLLIISELENLFWNKLFTGNE